MDAADSSSPGGLRERASAALGWSFLNVLVGRVGTMGIGIVLARLLGPDEFGTYAVAYVALVAVLSFNELGVSLAIVRWPGDPKEIAGTVTTISLVASCLIAGVGVVLAPTFTAAMGSPEATPVVRLLALNVIISGAVQSPAALLQRAFRQRARMAADQVNVWVGAVTSVVLALAGSGAMSLAVGRLAGALTSGVLLVVLSPIPYRLEYRPDKARALLRFGLPLAGASMLVFLVGYADQLVVGRMLGPTALGFYVLALNLAGWPLSLFSLPLRGVAPPAFARLQHDPARMRSAFTVVVELVAKVSVPVCVCMAAAAVPLVQLVYGDAWLPASEILPWLALVSAVKIFHELAYDFLVVLGSSRGVLWVQAMWLVVVVPLMVLGAVRYDAAGVAAAHLLAASAVVLPAYLLLLRRGGVVTSAVLRSMVVPTLGGVAVASCVAVAVHFLGGPVLALLTTALIGSAAIAVMLYPRRALLRELVPGRATGGAVAAVLGGAR